MRNDRRSCFVLCCDRAVVFCCEDKHYYVMGLIDRSYNVLKRY